MNKTEIQEKLAELIQNEEFVSKVSGVEVGEALGIMKEYGLEITEEELKENLGALAGASEYGEISENELERVAGGAWYTKYAETAKGLWDGFYGTLKSAAKTIINNKSKKK